MTWPKVKTVDVKADGEESHAVVVRDQNLSRQLPKTIQCSLHTTNYVVRAMKRRLSSSESA